MKTSSILLLILTLTLVLPIGFSSVHAESQTNDDNKTRSNDNDTKTDVKNMNGTNVGQEVSDFVHNATAAFKQQRAENIQAIKDCHEKIRSATDENRTQIINDCHTTMASIREKYKDLRTQFQNLFKEFRENLLALKHDAEGSKLSDSDRDNAIKAINDDAVKHEMKHLNMTSLKEMKDHGKMSVGQEMHNPKDQSDMHGKH